MVRNDIVELKCQYPTVQISLEITRWKIPKIQTAIDGTENTVKTDTGKILHRKLISGPLFQTEERSRKEKAITRGEIAPKNRYCLRGLEGNKADGMKYCATS